MKRLFLIIIILTSFLIANIPATHAQWNGFSPYYFDQYGYPLGAQFSTPGYFGMNNFITQPQFTFQNFSPVPTYPSWGGSTYSSTYTGYDYLNNGYPLQGDLSFVRNRAFLNTESLSTDLFSSDYYPPGIPGISSISFNPSTRIYNAPGWHNPGFPPLQVKGIGGISIWTPDATGRGWGLLLSPLFGSPLVYSNGTQVSNEGASEVKTITIEDNGKTFTFHSGEIFRIVLPMYDDISKEDFPMLAGWIEEEVYEKTNWESAPYIYGFKHLEFGLEEDKQGNLIQEDVFMTIGSSAQGSSFISKELVYNYRSPYNSNEIKDTFRVTLIVE